MGLVLLAYAFFASAGKWEFHTIRWFDLHSDSPGADYYPRLAEGFRLWHLYMAGSVDPRMETLTDPYNPQVRSDAGIEALWDASYYRGHYYLYFTPLPVLLFHLPFRLMTGAYPPDSIAALFFCSWAFVMSVLFLTRALPGKRIVLWIFVAGFANVIAFSLPDVRVYEVAVMCAMAMTMTWAWALLRFVEQPTMRRAVWMALWLAFAIASRPHLIVLLVPTFLALYAVRNIRIAAGALVPLAITAMLLCAYNFARFGKLFEFGLTYQIEFISMHGRRICSICNTKEVLRFVNNVEHYLFWAPSFDSRFPYVSIQTTRLDPVVSTPFLGADTVLGIVALTPLVLIGVLFALLFVTRPRDAATTSALHVMLGAWLTLAALSTCWWIVARYSLDFMLLMTVASIVLIERGFALFEELGLRTQLLRRASILLACYSIAVGVLFGFEGLGGSFRRNNPELFKQIGETLHVKVR